MWEILEIEPTTNIKVIKRAYAKLLTKYHPEDYPDKFMEIQQAYNAAICYAKSMNQQVVILQEEVSEEDRSASNDLSEEGKNDDSVLEEQKDRWEEENQSESDKKEEIPEYIIKIEEEKDEAFQQKRQESIKQFFDCFRKGITTRGKKDIKEFLAWMNTVSFSQIAREEYVQLELKKILLEANYCNPTVIKHLKKYYQGGNDKKRETEMLDILSSDKMKKKQNWYRVQFNQISSVKKETAILCLILFFFLTSVGAAVFSIKQSEQNNSGNDRRTPKNTMVKQFQNLLMDEYQLETAEARLVDVFIDSKIKTDSNFVYLSSYFSVNEKESFPYGALYSLSEGKIVDGKCNLNHRLLEYYENKYLFPYCHRLEALTGALAFSETEWDMEPLQLNMFVCVDNIEEFIPALREFEENFFQDPLVIKEGKTYELKLELNGSTLMGLPESLYQPGEIYKGSYLLTAKSHEIPYITIQREANKIKENRGEIADDHRWN